MAEPPRVTREPVGRLEDGTEYFSTLGVLEVDDAGEHVRCHLCGQWRKALAGKHLTGHGWTAASYREAFGLTASNPLVAPRTSARWSTVMRDRIERDDRLRESMAKAQEAARAGELGKRSAERTRGRRQPLEHRRRAAEAVDASERGRRARERHEQQVAERLGFPSFDAWYRTRRAAGWQLDAMAAEAGYAKVICV